MEKTDPNGVLFQSLSMYSLGDLPLNQYKGFWFLKNHLLTPAVENHFEPLPTDVILTSFPKTGTTWLKSLLFSIISRSSKDSLLSNHPHDLVPSLELQVYRGGRTSMPELLVNSSSRRIFSTHIPFQILPPSIKHSDCNGHRRLALTLHEQGEVHRDATRSRSPVDGFCKGAVPYGSYFDHALGYWKASTLEESLKKMFYITYEELKRDTGKNVRRLGEFLGCPFGEDDDEVEEIVRGCSFENLSNVDVNKSEDVTPWLQFSYSSFFRRGNVGDHKNYLTPEMVECIDKIAEEKLNNSGLYLD